MDRSELDGFTSELTLAEILVKPIREQNTDLVGTYMNLVRPASSLSIIPADRNVMLVAAEQRAFKPTLKLPDALHVASAMVVKADVFASFDRYLPLPVAMVALRDTFDSLWGPSP